MLKLCYLPYSRLKTTNLGTRLYYRSFFDQVNRDWETSWQRNVTPWETKSYSPPLFEIFHENRYKNIFQELSATDISSMRALVPGCGSGYDVSLLYHLGFKETIEWLYSFLNITGIVGLDLSSTAITQAIENSKLPHVYPTLSHANKENHSNSKRNYSSMDIKNISFQSADFFTYQSTEQFDFIFDYLFFSAINPNSRQIWARSIAKLLKYHRNSILYTLIFPYHLSSDQMNIDSNWKKIGPPYIVNEEDYRIVLEPFHLKPVYKFMPETSIKPRKGREYAVIWKYDI